MSNRQGASRPRTLEAVTISSVIVALLTAVFVLQNTEDATVNFLGWKATVPLAVALLLAVVLGGMLGVLISLLRPLLAGARSLIARRSGRAR
jgi:uncharacterized integral membrane protein